MKKISLHFVVLSFDRYSRDEMIGEVVCSLSSVSGLETADNQQISLCREICARSLKVLKINLIFFIIVRTMKFINLTFDIIVFLFLFVNRFSHNVEVNYWYHYVGNQLPID